VLRVTFKGLFAHKARFFLTGLAVIIGIAFLAGSLVLTDTIKQTFDDLFSTVYKGTDVAVRSRNAIKQPFGGADLRPSVPASLVEKIGNVDGVDQEGGKPVAFGQLTEFSAQFVNKNGKSIGHPGRGAPTLGFIWNPFPRLSPWRLQPGGHPPEANNQIVVDAGVANTGNFKVGDRVSLTFNSGPVTRATYKIVGIAKFGTADSPGGATAAIFTQAEAQRLNQKEGRFDIITVAAKPGVSQEQLARRVRTALGNPAFQVITGAQLTKETQNQIERGLSFFNTFLLVFAGVALFVGSFIIFNTFSIIVAQRGRELALMRAIGASSRQVLGSVILESLVVGLLASAVGLGVGVVLALGLKALLAGFGVKLPAASLVIRGRTVVVAMIVGTVVTLVAAVFPARRAARMPPIAALRAVASDTSGGSVIRIVIGSFVTLLGVALLLTGLFASAGIALVGVGAVLVFLGVAFLGPVIARPVSRIIGWPLSRYRGVSGNLARANAARNPKRTASTAAALMIGVALVALITVLASSTRESIGAAIDKSFRADFIVSGQSGGPDQGFSPALGKKIAALPQVGATTALRASQFEIKGSGQLLFAADPKAVLKFIDFGAVKGHPIRELGPHQIAISKDVANSHNWKVGTVLDARVQTGREKLQVGSIFERGTQQGLGDYFVSLDAFERFYENQIDFNVFANLKPGVSAEEGRRAIARVADAYPSAKVQDIAQYKVSQESQIDTFVNLIYVMLALAILIAGIGIANTLALSIVERTREIGLLRAVGMSRPQLKSTIRWEAVIVALLGTLLGLVIGLFFGWAVVKSLSSQGVSEFAAPGGQLFVIVLIAALLAILFAYFPARRAAKLDVLSAISTE
jgi:putative ABC transport system permease protein